MYSMSVVCVCVYVRVECIGEGKVGVHHGQLMSAHCYNSQAKHSEIITVQV